LADPIDVSIVLPSYRAAPLAVESAQRLQAFLPTTGLSWEIIIVDDGGGDFPKDVWPPGSPIRLIELAHNRGKGAAVTTGMLASSGRVRIFTDVDLPYGLEPLSLMIHLALRRGFHLVIGDRTLPGSTYRRDQSWTRRLLSAGSAALIGSLVTGGFHDTQCGIKALRGDIAPALFRLVRTARFTFDVELIYCALKHRLDIKRIPVTLRCNTATSVRPVRDGLQGLADLARIKFNEMTGRYQSIALDELVAADLDLASREAADLYDTARATIKRS